VRLEIIGERQQETPVKYDREPLSAFPVRLDFPAETGCLGEDWGHCAER
jgi:hypothetical protein